VLGASASGMCAARAHAWRAFLCYGSAELIPGSFEPECPIGSVIKYSRRHAGGDGLAVGPLSRAVKVPPHAALPSSIAFCVRQQLGQECQIGVRRNARQGGTPESPQDSFFFGHCWALIADHAPRQSTPLP